MPVLDQERSKLDNHSEKYVFIGIVQAPRALSWEIHALEINWNVEFDEECISNWLCV